MSRWKVAVLAIGYYAIVFQMIWQQRYTRAAVIAMVGGFWAYQWIQGRDE